jgi:hypothetical protein
VASSVSPDLMLQHRVVYTFDGGFKGTRFDIKFAKGIGGEDLRAEIQLPT